MEKNYYEILEVNKNASPEIIEKAYKTLAKKYHPDLQSEENKQKGEEIFKQINEAYEVLSNSEKRKQYDITLEEKNPLNEQIEELYNENIDLKQQIYNMKKNNNSYNIKQYDREKVSQNNYSNTNQNEEFEKRRREVEYYNNLNNTIKQAYHDAYVQDLKNRGYKIRYKKTWRERIKDLIALIITILIFLAILQIPVVQQFFISIYEENPFVKMIVNAIINIFN